jgi:hypothetical protein
VFLAAAAVHYISLARSDFANGWDGYYYLMQAQSFVEYGYLQSKDYSLIYPYYIVLSFIIQDYVLAFQLGTALLAATFSVSLFFIIYHSFHKDLGLATLGAVLTIMSPGVLFYVSQFPKNLLGIIFLSWLLYFIYKKQLGKMIMMTILCFLTHRLSAGLAIMAMAVYFIHYINWKWLLIGLIGMIALTFSPGLLHISDLARFEGAFTNDWQFVPLEFLQSGITGGHLLWSIEVWLIVAILLIYLIMIGHNLIKKKELGLTKVLSVIFIFVVLMPFFKFSIGSMGYRFFLLVFFGYPLLLVFLLKNIPNQLVRAVGLGLILLSPISIQAYNPAIHNAPNRLYFMIADKIQEHYDEHRYPLIIAHKSLAEVIIYHTDFDALNYAPEIEDNKDSIARVVHGIPQRYLKKYDEEIQNSNYLRINHQYAVISESAWEQLLRKANALQDQQLLDLIESGNNPMQIRPEFIKKGKE